MTYNFKRVLMAITVLASLSACTHTAQYTSGKAYLKAYTETPYTSTTTIDQEVRDIAAIEPNLRFPARIGLARIEKGKLISLPADEALHWGVLENKLEGTYGTFVPVSPLIADMVNQTTTGQSQKVVDHIRRGAARQHLDYVLIYEVINMANSERNALQMADLSILGLFVLPSRNIEASATATAILIDVRNGYPYGTMSNFTDRKTLTTATQSSDKKRNLEERSRRDVVEKLTGDVSHLLYELKEVEAK